MIASIHAIPLKVSAAALALVVLTAGHAVAKNHDCQSFKQPSIALAAIHDHAPSPAAR